MIPEAEPVAYAPIICPPGQPIPLEPDSGESNQAFAVRSATMRALAYYDQAHAGPRRMRLIRFGDSVLVTIEPQP
jgi:hypothetical protein